ncbi:hypothetical protein [Corynebacterium matruchotii]
MITSDKQAFAGLIPGFCKTSLITVFAGSNLVSLFLFYCEGLLGEP